MTLEALIFDVDGTLADTEEVHRQAFNAAFREHGLDWHWTASTYTGLLDVTGGKERIHHYLDSLGWRKTRRDEVAACVPALHRTKTGLYAAAISAGQIRLREGILSLLRNAREQGVRMAIATTTAPENVTALLHSVLGADGEAWFDVIAAGDMVRDKKPAPDVYLLALERLGAVAANCVAIEDSRNGLTAAKAAGLRTAVTPCQWTLHHDFRTADLLVWPGTASASPVQRCRLDPSAQQGQAHCIELDLATLASLVAPGTGNNRQTASC